MWYVGIDWADQHSDVADEISDFEHGKQLDNNARCA